MGFRFRKGENKVLKSVENPRQPRQELNAQAIAEVEATIVKAEAIIVMAKRVVTMVEEALLFVETETVLNPPTYR
ncbi:hypothetical protein RDI58_024252 [Solanum bulbocastanum]|uniref:Uncharacterized protein n=1 Tax=Solanum bulbocastanum TaxID=147425 RepID=A0AAN8Y2S5_SOLBU